jgi:hypothetical protein
MENIVRKVLLLIALLSIFLFGRASAQQVTRLGVETAVSLRLQSNEWRYEALPSFFLERGRHSLGLGPSLFLQSLDGSPKGIRFNGLALSHAYRLRAEETSLFYWHTQVIAQRNQERWTRNYWDAQQGVYVDQPAGNREDLLAAYIGPGLRYFFSTQGFIQLRLLGGLYMARFHNEQPNQPAPDFYRYPAYDESGFSYRASLGVGFRL